MDGFQLPSPAKTLLQLQQGYALEVGGFGQQRRIEQVLVCRRPYC